jgi:hypothetical protein
MTSPPGQPPITSTKHILIRAGFVIGIIAFSIAMLVDLFSPSENNALFQGIPCGILAFCGVWTLCFAGIEYYWVQQPAFPMASQKSRMIHPLIVAAILISGIVEMEILRVVNQTRSSGSDKGILPLMLLFGVTTAISAAIFIYYISPILANSEKTQISVDAAGPVLPQQESPSITEKEP